MVLSTHPRNLSHSDETVGIQTHYHQSTLPTSKWARWKISSNGKESANQSKARLPRSISRIIRVQEHTLMRSVHQRNFSWVDNSDQSSPTTEAQLQRRVLDPNKVKEKLRLKQEKQKYYFDQHNRQLQVLEKGEQTRVRMGNRWEPGVTVDHAEKSRSYKVKTDNGGEYRRDRKMLMKHAGLWSCIDKWLKFSWTSIRECKLKFTLQGSSQSSKSSSGGTCLSVPRAREKSFRRWLFGDVRTIQDWEWKGHTEAITI